MYEIDKNNNLIIKKHQPSQVYDSIPPSVPFDDNLAPYLSPLYLKKLGRNLLEATEQEKKSQEAFLGALSEGIKYLGISFNDEGIPVRFQEGSNVYSTAFVSTLLQIMADTLPIFSQLTYKIPSTHNMSPEEQENLDQIGIELREFFKNFLNSNSTLALETKKNISWAIFAGTATKKIFIDSFLKQPMTTAIHPYNFIIKDNLITGNPLQPKTQLIKEDQLTFKKKVQGGIYHLREQINPKNILQDTLSPLESAVDEMMAVTPPFSLNSDDNLYHFYERHCFLEIKEDPFSQGKLAPFIVTLSTDNGEIVRLVRNWDDPNITDDFILHKKEFFVNYTFMPAFKGDGLGLTQLVGKSAKQATLLKRVICNNALYANYPTLVSLGGKIESKSYSFDPGTLNTIIAPNVHSISEALQPLPYQNPSPEIMNLADKLEEQILTPYSSLLSQDSLDIARQAPTSTLLAILTPQYQKTNYILNNFFLSFGKELEVLMEKFKICAQNPDYYPFFKEFNADPNWFFKGIKIVPANDASYYNNSFRILKAELLLETALKAPEIHNMTEAYKNYYESLGLDQATIDKLLTPPQPEQAQAAEEQPNPELAMAEAQMEDTRVKERIGELKHQIDTKKLELEALKAQQQLEEVKHKGYIDKEKLKLEREKFDVEQQKGYEELEMKKLSVLSRQEADQQKDLRERERLEADKEMDLLKLAEKYLPKQQQEVPYV